MKKDIQHRKVTDIAIAIVPRSEEDELWDTFILNLKPEPIKSVLVNSRGYGNFNGEKVETTTLRHFFEEINADTAVQIEPILKDMFRLTNEYWISFSLDNYMFDKKYVFVSGSIDKMNFTQIPIINRQGVMIR